MRATELFGHGCSNAEIARMLGWSLQRPQRRAVERDESEIARWIALE
ncbi:winged helix-turn-helix domain-containing protein [Streptomyces globisporus]|nr:winged helix-turn-helix domain-containing protein [Streptomyces globisporus]